MRPIPFFTSVLILSLAVVACWLSIVFNLSDYQELAQLNGFIFHDYGYYSFGHSFAENDFKQLQWVFTLLATGSLLTIFFCYLKRGSIFSEWVILSSEFRQTLLQLKDTTYNLTNVQKITALSLFVLLLTVRLYFMVQFPFHTDEIASYDYFVSQGMLVTGSFYPIPNNHILTNLFSAFIYHFTTDFTVVMRLPAFLISLAGTIILFLFLFRQAGFFVAIVALAFYSFAELSLFFSIAGRGYALYMLLAVLVFWSNFQIIHQKRFYRLAWLVFILASVAGFYTIPIFLYPFASVLLISFYYFSKHKQFQGIIQLILAAAMVGLLSLLLYVPVFQISGLNALVGNSYVDPENFKTFWSGFINFFFRTERAINGFKTVGFILFLVTLLLFYGLILRKNENKLPELLTKSGLAGMLFLPFLLVIIQRVYPPDRVFIYKIFFFYLIFAGMIQYFLQQYKVKARIALLLVFLLYAIAAFNGTSRLLAEAPPKKETAQQIKNVYDRLELKASDKILITQLDYQLYFLHFSYISNNNLNLFSELDKKIAYDYLILDKSTKQFINTVPFMYLFENEDVKVLKRK